MSNFNKQGLNKRKILNLVLLLSILNSGSSSCASTYYEETEQTEKNNRRAFITEHENKLAFFSKDNTLSDHENYTSNNRSYIFIDSNEEDIFEENILMQGCEDIFFIIN